MTDSPYAFAEQLGQPIKSLDDYLKTLTVSAEVIKPGDAARALAKPGVKGKVLKQLGMERGE